LNEQSNWKALIKHKKYIGTNFPSSGGMHYYQSTLNAPFAGNFKIVGVSSSDSCENITKDMKSFMETALKKRYGAFFSP
jgi:hypothetical protein